MHEVGLMEEALRLALIQAEQASASRIHAVTIRIGPLAGVDTEALRLAFEAVTMDTVAHGAALCLEEAPVRCWCARCERLFVPADSVFRCPQCRQLSADIRQGRELDLIAVEIS